MVIFTNKRSFYPRHNELHCIMIGKYDLRDLIISHHYQGYKPQSKLWKQIPQQAAGYYILRMLDNSTNKLQRTLFLKFGSHYPTLRGIIRRASFTALRF